MTDLPASWEWTTIGDLLAPMEDGRTIHQGWSPRCEKTPSPSDEVWGVLKTTAIQPGAFLPEHNKELPSGLDPRAAIEVQPGDMLLTCAGPRSRCGVSCLVRSTRPKLMMSGKMYRFRVDEQYVSSRYLEAYLQSALAWAEIDQMKTGGSDSGLNLTQARFRTLPVPLAPRDEQEHIVTAIEEQLSRVDAGTSLLSYARERAAKLSQRLLDHAVEGDPVPLGELLLEPLRNGLSAASSPNGSIRVVTLTAVTKSEFVDAHTKVIEPGYRSVDDLWMRPGDIFIQRSNTPDLVGTAALYDGAEGWSIFPDLLIRVRVDETLAIPAYLAMVLRSTAVRRYFQRSAQGIAGSMPKISQPTVAAAEVPLPSVERQTVIMQQMHQHMAVVQRLGAETQRFAERAGSLRRAILAAAFSGQLSKQSDNDDPAFVLLDRIRSERELAAAHKTRKATTS